MRIYEGSPRQDFEEVFRSIGAFLDSRGMRDILLLEVPDGFIVQGLVAAGAVGDSAWSETVGSITKETLTFLDDDIAKFMEEAAARRGRRAAGRRGGRRARARAARHRPLDGRAEAARTCSCSSRTAPTWSGCSWRARRASHHTISEFTREDVETLIAQGPDLRNKPKDTGADRSRRSPRCRPAPPAPAPGRAATPRRRPTRPTSWGEPAS